MLIMKKYLFIILLLLFAVAIYADSKPRVMVLNAVAKRNFYDTYRIGDGEEFLTTELRKAILEEGVFYVINNDKVLDEALESQYEGSYDITTVAKYGKKLGANYAIVPKVLTNKVQQDKSGVLIKFRCNVELYNLATGELLYSTSVQGEKKDAFATLNTKDDTAYGNPKIHGLFTDSSKGAASLIENLSKELSKRLANCVGGEKIYPVKLSKSELKADTFLELEKSYLVRLKKGVRGKLLYYENDYSIDCGECFVESVSRDKARLYVTKLSLTPPKKSEIYVNLFIEGLINPEAESELFPIVPLKKTMSAIVLPVCQETDKHIVNDIICDEFAKRNFDITDEATRNKVMENQLEQSKLKDDPEGYLRLLENKLNVDLAVIPEIGWKVSEKDNKATSTLALKIVDMRSLETIFSKSLSQTAPGATPEDAVNNAFRLLVSDMFDDSDIINLVNELNEREEYITLVVNNVPSVTVSNEVQKKIFATGLTGKIERVSFEKGAIVYKIYSVKKLDNFIEKLETLEIGKKHFETKKFSSNEIILELL